MAADRDRREPEELGWEALAQAWQQIAPPKLTQAPAELRRRVLRADLSFKLCAIAEYACYVGLVLLVAWFLKERKGTAAFLWGFMMLGFVAWGLDFAVRIRQGVWQAADSTTAAWLDLLAERCARRRRYARVSWLMLGVMFVAMALMLAAWSIWLPQDFARVATHGWKLVGVMLATLGIQYLWWTRYLRRIEAEEREIAALRGEPESAP